MKRIFVIFAVVLLAIAQGDPTFTAGGNVAPQPASAKIGGGPSGGGGSSGEEFEVDVDSGVQSALDKIIGSGSAQVKSGFKSAAAAKPSQAEFNTAASAAPAGAAKVSYATAMSGSAPASSGAGKAGGVGSASNSMIIGRPFPGPGPIDYYPYYRRRLRCRVSYWPTWKICCWFTWWWWYMY